MNIKSLKQFLSLAESLHFGRASDDCNISVSALSRNIRHLEEELGATLFHRDNRTVRLTREGERFLAYARETSQQWTQIQNGLHEQSGQLSGEVSIYCSVTASYSFLYELLNRFRQIYPGIEIKLHTGDPEHAITRIQSGSEDIAMAATPERLPAGVEFSPVGDTPLLFIAPLSQQEMANNFTIGSSEVRSAIPMILPESGVAREHVNSWLRDQQVQPTIYAQVTGNEAIVTMVSLGFGVGVVPKIVLDNSPLASQVQVLDINPKLGDYAVGLFTQQKALKNPLISAFWSLLSK